MIGKMNQLIFLFFLWSVCVLHQSQSSTVKIIDSKVGLNNNKSVDIKQLYILLRKNNTIDNVKFDYDTRDYCLYWQGDCYFDFTTTDSSIVIRVYEEKQEEFSNTLFNRTREEAIIEVAGNLNLTAKLIAKFNNGIVLDYIEGEPAYRDALSANIRLQVAQKLARLHHARSSLGDFLDKTPMIEEDRFESLDSKNMEEYYDHIEEEDKEFVENVPKLPEIEEKIENLISWLHQLDAFGPVVLSHNFLKLKNILINEQTETPYFRDFLTSNTNYQSWDLSFLFYWMDVETSYPINRDLEREFLRYYHLEYNRLNRTRSMTGQRFELFLDDAYIKLQANKLLLKLIHLGTLVYEQITTNNMYFTKRSRNQTIDMWNQYLSDKLRVEQLIEQGVGSNTNSIASNVQTVLFLCGALLLWHSKQHQNFV